MVKKNKQSNIKQIRSVVKSVISQQSERKVLDTDLSTVAANSTTGVVVTKLTPPAQGDTASTRDGDQLWLTSLRIHGLVNCVTDRNTNIRMILIQWLEDDGDTVPVIGDILQNTTANDLASSFYLVNPTKKFKILSDKLYNFDANNDAAQKTYHVSVTGKQFAIQKMSFNAGATTGVGQLYLLSMGSKLTGSCDRLLTRMRYLDN